MTAASPHQHIRTSLPLDLPHHVQTDLPAPANSLKRFKVKPLSCVFTKRGAARLFLQMLA